MREIRKTDLFEEERVLRHERRRCIYIFELDLFLLVFIFFFLEIEGMRISSKLFVIFSWKVVSKLRRLNILRKSVFFLLLQSGIASLLLICHKFSKTFNFLYYIFNPLKFIVLNILITHTIISYFFLK